MQVNVLNASSEWYWRNELFFSSLYPAHQHIHFEIAEECCSFYSFWYSPPKFRNLGPFPLCIGWLIVGVHWVKYISHTFHCGNRIVQILHFVQNCLCNWINTRISIIFLQILSGNFLRSYGKDVINIHHGLLPSFKGGNPSKQVSYFHFIMIEDVIVITISVFPPWLHKCLIARSCLQAFDAGVKLIGATSHFVTEELDEGPIIEQMVIIVFFLYCFKYCIHSMVGLSNIGTCSHYLGCYSWLRVACLWLFRVWSNLRWNLHQTRPGVREVYLILEITSTTFYTWLPCKILVQVLLPWDCIN